MNGLSLGSVMITDSNAIGQIQLDGICLSWQNVLDRMA